MNLSLFQLLMFFSELFKGIPSARLINTSLPMSA